MSKKTEYIPGPPPQPPILPGVTNDPAIVSLIERQKADIINLKNKLNQTRLLAAALVMRLGGNVMLEKADLVTISQNTSVQVIDRGLSIEFRVAVDE